MQKKSTNISLKNQKQIKSKNKLCLADFLLIDFCLKRREITRDGWHRCATGRVIEFPVWKVVCWLCPDFTRTLTYLSTASYAFHICFGTLSSWLTNQFSGGPSVWEGNKFHRDLILQQVVSKVVITFCSFSFFLLWWNRGKVKWPPGEYLAAASNSKGCQTLANFCLAL